MSIVIKKEKDTPKGYNHANSIEDY